MRPLRADDSLDKERQRQQAQDDMSEEAEENRRERYEADSSELHDLAPKIERLDPESVPVLYPEFDLEEESNAKRDDSWYVDSDYAESEAAPLWKRRAAENLGARTAEAAVDGSMFDLCAAALREEGDITVLDVADRCEWTARMVISRAQNTRHMRAIGERLLRTIKERQRRNGVTSAIQVDGRESEDWMVVDMGRFVVHIMTPAAHEMYDLESLWTAPLDEQTLVEVATDADSVPDTEEVGSENGKKEADSTPGKDEK